MAEHMMKAFLLWATVFLCGQSGRGLALEINISPDKMDAFTPTEVNISCIPSSNIDLDAQEIMMMQIIGSDEKPVAALKHAGVSSFKHIIHSDFDIEGYIDDTPSKSYLRYTLLAAKEPDAGLYQCVLYYTDNDGLLKEIRVGGNLTTDDSKIISLVQELKDKISELDYKVKDQETNMSKEMTELQNQISDHKQTEAQLKSDISFLEDKLKDQKMEMIDFQIVHTRLSHAQSEIKESLKDLELRIKSQKSQDDYVCAFFARYKEKSSENNGDTIIFDQEMVNIGNDYNPNTGIFTAPRDGVYVFHLAAMMGNPKGFMDLALVNNNVMQGGLSMASPTNKDQSTTSIVLKLKVNDEVRVKVWNKKSYNMLLKGPFTYFSGSLLHQT